MLIVGGSGSGKTNELLNIINHEPDIEKIYLYAKHPYKPKHQFLINKRKDVDVKHFKYPMEFIVYSNDMKNVHKITKKYNPGKKKQNTNSV